MESVNAKLSNYRPDIDGLRAIAVLAVVAFHAFPEVIHGGFIGVDIFFVISGYLISGIIVSALKSDSFSFIKFYSRRVLRIFPALLLVLCTVLVCGWLFFLAEEYQLLGKHIVGSSIFISNLVLWFESGYFDKLAETKPLLHLWSLGIEEQFYLIWPLILWLLWRIRLNLLFLILIISIVSFAWNIKVVETDNIYAFFSPQTRFWELLIGAFFGCASLQIRILEIENKKPQSISLHLLKNYQNHQGKIQNISSYLGALLILLSLFCINRSDEFPGYLALLPTFGAALLIYGGQSSFINKYLLSSRILVSIGLVSYPLYLWHWPLFTFVRVVLGFAPPLTIKLILLAASFLLSYLTYRFLEAPIKRVSNNAKSYLALFLCVLMTFIGLAGYKIVRDEGFKSRAVVIKSNSIEKQFIWNYQFNDICLKKYSLTQDDLVNFRFCMQEKEAEPTILLLGNSYANQLYPGLASLSDLKKDNILSIGACNPVEPDGDAEYVAPPGHPCHGEGLIFQQKFIDDILNKAKTVKLVILAGLVENPSPLYISRLEGRIRELQAKGATVIIISPHIRPKFDPKMCSSRPYKFIETNCSFPASRIKEVENNFKPLVLAINKSNPSVKFFNPNDMYCNVFSCSFVSDGLPLNRDLGHLSAYGSEVLANNFIGWARVNVEYVSNRR